MLSPQERIGRDLWPSRKRRLLERAFAAKDGQPVQISLGEAETISRRETEREIKARLEALEAMDPSQKRPTKKPHPNYCDILID